MKKNCLKCHSLVDSNTINYFGECISCAKKRRKKEMAKRPRKKLFGKRKTKIMDISIQL